MRQIVRSIERVKENHQWVWLILLSASRRCQRQPPFRQRKVTHPCYCFIPVLPAERGRLLGAWVRALVTNFLLSAISGSSLFRGSARQAVLHAITLAAHRNGFQPT